MLKLIQNAFHIEFKQFLRKETAKWKVLEKPSFVQWLSFTRYSFSFYEYSCIIQILPLDDFLCSHTKLSSK